MGVGDKVNTNNGKSGIITDTNFNGDLFWVQYNDEPGFGAYFYPEDLSLN